MIEWKAPLLAVPVSSLGPGVGPAAPELIVLSKVRAIAPLSENCELKVFILEFESPGVFNVIEPC